MLGIKSLSRVRAPLEFKILISHRILGRGNCFDEIGELAGSFESSSGSSNDITICHNDDPTKLYENDQFADEEYYILLEDGQLQKCKVTWLLVDGGYPKLSSNFLYIT